MTKPRTCASCDNPASDGITICRRCERDTRRRLGDMDALREELELTMTRQAKMQAERQGSRSTATPPLTFAEDAAELLHEQRNILVSWSRLVHDEIDQVWPERDTIRYLALFIEGHMSRLRKHQAAGDLVGELCDFARKAMACIDYPDDRVRINVHACIIQTADGPCAGRIVLHYPHDADVYADCITCESRWSGSQLNRLGQLINKAAA